MKQVKTKYIKNGKIKYNDIIYRFYENINIWIKQKPIM